MSDIALRRVIESNYHIRKEYEGPTGLEGPSPRGGWSAIRDTSCDNKMKRDGLVLRHNEQVCVKCHTVKSVTNTCLCS